MSKATYIAATPAVPRTEVISPEQPAKVVIEVSIREARLIRALIAVTNGMFGQSLFDELEAIPGVGNPGFPDADYEWANASDPQLDSDEFPA